MFARTLVHDAPPLRVTCTLPSSVPAQINPGARGDSARATTVQCTSAPLVSGVSPPELGSVFFGSFVLKSGLMITHVRAPSTLRNTWLPPTYSVCGLCGDISIGARQLNRNPAGQPCRGVPVAP